MITVVFGDDPERLARVARFCIILVRGTPLDDENGTCSSCCMKTCGLFGSENALDYSLLGDSIA
jgi:hypothetical protein